MFQRTGHDYSLNDQDPAEWLHICYLDRRRLMETGMFGSRLINQPFARFRLRELE